MSALSNHRRELFAQLLVQGFTAVDAHEKAGFKRNDGNASALARHPEIEARIIEIKGELMVPKGEHSQSMPLGTSIIAAKANLTAQDLISMQNRVYEAGLSESRNLSAASTAAKEISILTGHRIARAEIGSPGEFDRLSDTELERLIVERFIQRGFAKKLTIGNGSIALNGNGADTDIEGSSN